MRTEITRTEKGQINIVRPDNRSQWGINPANLSIFAMKATEMCDIHILDTDYIYKEKMSDVYVNGTQMTPENASDLIQDINALGGGGAADQNDKGYFETEVKLQEKWPTPQEGNYAWVGSPYPGTVYDVVDGEWRNTGEVPPTPSVDLDGYATTEQLTHLGRDISTLDNTLDKVVGERIIYDGSVSDESFYGYISTGEYAYRSSTTYKSVAVNIAGVKKIEIKNTKALTFDYAYFLTEFVQIPNTIQNVISMIKGAGVYEVPEGATIIVLFTKDSEADVSKIVQILTKNATGLSVDMDAVQVDIVELKKASLKDSNTLYSEKDVINIYDGSVEDNSFAGYIRTSVHSFATSDVYKSIEVDVSSYVGMDISFVNLRQLRINYMYFLSSKLVKTNKVVQAVISEHIISSDDVLLRIPENAVSIVAFTKDTVADISTTIKINITLQSGILERLDSLESERKEDSISILNSLSFVGMFDNPFKNVSNRASILYSRASILNNIPDDVMPLIIIAGQSNSDGRAPLSSLPANILDTNNSLPDFMMFNRLSKTFATYRLGYNAGGYTTTSTSFAFDVFFAKQFLADNQNKKLYAIKQTDGGVPITLKGNPGNHGQRWSAEIDLIPNTEISMCVELLQQIADAKQYAEANNLKLRIVAILWHQGENDAYNNAVDEYAVNLSNLMSFLRGIFNTPSLPFINGTIVSTYAANYPLINEIFFQLNNLDSRMKTVDMTGRETTIDGLHYDATALQYMGEQMYRDYKSLI